MQGLSQALLKKIDITASILAESGSTRNLVPEEPGWDRLAARSKELSQWLQTTLRSGFQPTPQRVSRVRKTPGVRPVAHWGPAERIVYRALAKALLGDSFDVDRTPKKYVDFIKSPVDYSFARQREQFGEPQTALEFFFLQSPLKYVVRSDIAAFYQYIDHAVLGAEIRVKGGDYDIANALLEILRETQGREYGLPQLLDASDALSEVYIDIVERALLRQGYPTWRFNDDFRIGCESYSEALRSIEALDAAARDVGLVLNENKTLTYGFMTYMVNSLNVEITDEQKSVLLDEVEAQVGDYTDDFSEDTDSARDVLTGARLGGSDQGMDLQRATSENVRLLRRALNALASEQDASAVEDARRIFAYVPELTPSVLRYLREVHDEDSSAVEGALDSIIERTSLNDWQRLWVTDTLRRLNLLDGETIEAKTRTRWVDRVRITSDSSTASAVASLAMAQAAKRTFREVVHDYEQSPSPTLTWNLEAIREALRLEPTAENQKSVEAIAATTPMHRALLS